MNATGTKTLQELGRDEYERFLSNLVAKLMGGLENLNTVNIIENYLTLYNCK